MCDSSVLIELAKRQLLDKLFALEFVFAVPDSLFYEELIDLGSFHRNDLLASGLQVEALDSDGVETAVAFQRLRPALSTVDAFALSLAKQRGWDLLTEDRVMREVARTEGVDHYDTLWIIDGMINASAVSAGRLIRAMRAMRDDPRCPVPKPELDRRLFSLGVDRD